MGIGARAAADSRAGGGDGSVVADAGDLIEWSSDEVMDEVDGNVPPAGVRGKSPRARIKQKAGGNEAASNDAGVQMDEDVIVTKVVEHEGRWSRSSVKAVSGLEHVSRGVVRCPKYHECGNVVSVNLDLPPKSCNAMVCFQKHRNGRYVYFCFFCKGDLRDLDEAGDGRRRCTRDEPGAKCPLQPTVENVVRYFGAQQLAQQDAERRGDLVDR